MYTIYSEILTTLTEVLCALIRQLQRNVVVRVLSYASLVFAESAICKGNEQINAIYLRVII